MISKLIPACKDYLWGGQTLKEQYGKQCETQVLAETWELSCHPDGLSLLAETGKTFAEYAEAHPQELGSACARFAEFPVLIKLIDAAKALSVQVHPDNAYAKAQEGQAGKTEMWYIVHAEPDAYLYYGLAQPLTKHQLRTAIEADMLCPLLRKVPVKQGDVFYIEAGTLHAIGEGIIIAEIQQSSNVTYRVYDYGRLGTDGKPRALHIDKACDVAALEPAPLHYNFRGHLAQCESFTVDKLTVNGLASLCADATSFHALLCVEGAVQLTHGGTSLVLQKGESVFISAGTGAYTLQGEGILLQTYVEPAVYRVGIDLGGTNIKAGVVNPRNEIIATHKCKTLVGRPWQEITADMAAAVRTALANANLTIADCAFCGIGSPGILDAATGDVVYANNFFWENIPLGKTLRQELGLPVYVSNDANCAALGEFVAGAAQEADSAVLLTLGTGVGGGAVFHGKIFEGGGPGGAELGHTTLIAGGEPCTCGRKGCIEAYCSATALIREARRAAQAHPESALALLCEGNLDNMDGRIPFDAARAGDAAAKDVVRRYLDWLGESIINMVNIFRPEVILLSGGICGEGAYLTTPLNAYVQQHAYAGERAPIPEVKIALLGNDAGIVGASSLGC